MSEVTSYKSGLSKLFLKQTDCCLPAKVIKNTFIPTSSSPLHRPNSKLPKSLSGKRLKHLSCPVQTATKRLWYECPKCHRFRNFLDDRDQFILYGVTALWPTPPPAPPASSSPQVEDSGSTEGLEGTYNICRVFHTSSAKLHPRNSPKKINAFTQSPGFVRTSPVRNKTRPKRKNRRSGILNANSYSSKTTSADLVHMLDLLRRYVTPKDNFILKRSVSTSSNVRKLITQNTVSTIESTEKAMSPVHKSLETPRLSSPKTQRTVVRKSVKRTLVTTTSSHSTCLSRSNVCQSISPEKLESWTRRLRNGVYIKKNDSSGLDNSRNQTNATSDNSNLRHKRHAKKKNKKLKRVAVVTKTTDDSRTNSVVSTKADPCDTSSGKDSLLCKSEAFSPIIGQCCLDGENLANTISSSRTERVKRKHRVRKTKRFRSVSARRSPGNEDGQRQAKSNTNVVAQIEAVKIGEEKVTTPRKKKSKRLRMKKSTGSVNLLEKTPEANTFPLETKSVSISSSVSSRSPRSGNDPVTLLEDFRSRMKKCQGKGFIKTAHIEVMAYLEGKKPDVKVQTLPKTYQQMGLAPLTRSESSENCTHFLNFKCAFSDTEISPKLVVHGRKKKKKKQKRPSLQMSPTRKGDGETMSLKTSEESGSAFKKVRKSKSLGKQKSHGQRANQQNAIKASVSAIAGERLTLVKE